MCNPNAILREVLVSYSDASKWINTPFERIKRISNTKVGDVGQDFVERLCKCIGFEVQFPVASIPETKSREVQSEKKRMRQSSWDMKIEGITFEIKTASEDVKGSFQFNHIRHHREYEALLCLGIAPEEILFDAWSKADVTTNKAGKLVTMDKGSSATWKLTKRKDHLLSINNFEEHILNLVAKLT